MTWPTVMSTGLDYRHPIEICLPVIARAGFRIVEVATARGHVDLFSPGKVARVAETIRELGLTVHSMHAPFGRDVDPTSPDAMARESSFELLTRAADALVTLGGRLYVTHPGGDDDTWSDARQERLDLAVEGLERMWRLCRQRDLELVVETPLPHLLGGRLDDFAWLLDRIPAEGTSVCVDTSHTSLGGSLFEAIERFGSRLSHIQASDNRGTCDDHLPPGEGILDWAQVRWALESATYRGAIAWEIDGSEELGATLDRVQRGLAGAWARALAWTP